MGTPKGYGCKASEDKFKTPVMIRYYYFLIPNSLKTFMENKKFGGSVYFTKKLKELNYIARLAKIKRK